MPETGALPYQLLKQAAEAGYINGLNLAHLQPSSLDLSLSDTCFEVRGSALPANGETVEAMMTRHAIRPHDLRKPLQVGSVYLVRLNESLALPDLLHARSSNKSSSGRINLRGRLLADGVASFDEVPAGYRGPLWIELIPMSFAIRVHPGDRINQLRLFAGESCLNRIEHRIAFDQHRLLRRLDGTSLEARPETVGRGITMTIDLSTHETIGWRAKKAHEHVLDTWVFTHAVTDFFEPVGRNADRSCTIHPGEFYIFATKEKILIPPTHAAEMMAYDASKGEFRSHFAGFFDPGFGWHADDDKRGAIGVLEIEAYSHPFILRDGQPICLMTYERLLEAPEKHYGSDLGSNYHMQEGPRLAKWFRT